MSMNRRRSVRQILRDLFEDEVYAFAMAYAGSKSNYDAVRALENRLQ